MAKNADEVFRQGIKRVFVAMTAILTLSLTYRFAVEKTQARAALHAQQLAKATQQAAVQRARIALRDAARRRPASVPTHGYVRASAPLYVPTATSPSQSDPRLLKGRSSRS